MAMVPQIGPDGLPSDIPIIAYTEKVLEEKELLLRKYIQDNYSKIRNVERELAGLALEVKLTAGPKKAALEHLRKKIELSTEKIKVARTKEEHAKKVWEAASKALKDEEAYKQSLCDDLTRLVQESAAAQFSRLEGLRERLEAINPELRMTVNDFNSQNGSSHVEEKLMVPNKTENDVKGQHSSVQSFGKEHQDGQVHHTKSAGGRDHAVNKGRGKLVLQKTKGGANSGWTGAGFDTGDDIPS